MKYLATLFTLVAVLALSGNAFAECDVTWLECDGNGIFQPGGERSGGDYYFNVEGSSNGSYASWAGARWTFDAITLDPGCVIDQICITLGQDVGGFTHDGLVKVYLAPDSIAPEVQEGGNLAYPYAHAASSTLLENFNFVGQTDGYQDVFCYEPGDAGFDELAASVMDGTLVMAFVDGDANVAATWGGIGNYANEMGGPRLCVSCSCVPEPSTMLMIVMGGMFAGVMIRRRNRNK